MLVDTLNTNLHIESVCNSFNCSNYSEREINEKGWYKVACRTVLPSFMVTTVPKVCIVDE